MNNPFLSKDIFSFGKESCQSLIPLCAGTRLLCGGIQFALSCPPCGHGSGTQKLERPKARLMPAQAPHPVHPFRRQKWFQLSLTRFDIVGKRNCC